jgi:hypothetical protein
LGLILFVAACNPSGLTLEVVIDDPAMVRVELYAGADCGSDCPRYTTPPGLLPMSVEDAYIVEDPRPFVVEQKDFSDGVAGFRIETTNDSQLPILVAIGYNAANEIRWSWTGHWVDIPNGDSAHWKIHLTPTTAITSVTPPQAPGTERAAQWQNPSGGPACLLLEHWGSNFVPTRELLGPAADRDCDGVSETRECAPWIPNALATRPPVEQTSCVTPDAHLNGTSVCMLGGPECSETLATSRDCVAVDPYYCTPSSMCKCAGQVDEVRCFRQAIVDGTNGLDPMPYVKCAIHVDGSGNQCDSTQLEIDLGAVLSGSSRKCSGIRLNDGDTIQLGQYWHIGEGKLYIESFAQPCKADVAWSGGSTPQLTNFNIVDVAIDNGYHLVLPIRVEIKPGCADVAQSLCSLVPTNNTTETMFACVGAQPMMTAACAPDGLCATGPFCNGTCCKSGEVCGPDGCSCGGGSSCPVGDTCESVGPLGESQCGSVCCGMSGPCPQ